MPRGIKTGLTLVEVVVALAIGAITIEVLTSLFVTHSAYQGKVMGGESLQNYELRKVKVLSDDAQFMAKTLQSADPLLKRCLQTPCLKECLEVKDWRDLAWDDIPVLYYDSEGKKINDGGRFSVVDLKICKPLSPPKNQVKGNEAPVYAPGCNLKAKADWRSGPRKTIEFRLSLEILGRAGLKHTLYHYEPLPGRANSASGCGLPEQALYCKSPGAYLLKADFKANQAVCADPFFEGNYK